MKHFQWNGTIRRARPYKRPAAIFMAAAASACAMLFLAGCTGIHTAQQHDITSDATTTNGAMDSQATPTDAAAPVVTGETPIPAPQIVTASFAQDKINIQYPQIQGLGDDAREQAINDLIKNDVWNSQVEETLAAYQQDGVTVQLEMDLGYTVTLFTDELLSVAYTGTAYIEGGVHPSSMFHAITIDLKSGERLYLPNIAEIDLGLVERIKQSETAINETTEYVADSAQTAALSESLLGEIRESDSQYMIWALRNDSESDFYLTPDSLFVRVDVCHAAGDYALVEIPGPYTVDRDYTYDSALCLNTENQVISFQTESGQTASICISKDDQYMVYRLGTQENIEFEYPADKENSWEKFTYSYSEGETGGAMNSGHTRDDLIFQDAGYAYDVYQIYEGGEVRVGIMVSELASGAQTDIRGVADSLTGYWYDLTYGNYNIQIVTE